MTQFEQQLSGLIDFAAIKQQISIAQVLELISWEPTAQSSDQQRGPCPVHKSSSVGIRSFSVNTARDIYQCFSCGSQGNQLDLAAELFELPLYEAAREVCRRLGIEVPVVGR